MKRIAFTVDGIPAPQGSKNPFGGEANPRTRPWRAAVTAEAARVWPGDGPVIEGPVVVEAVFTFPRPKAHFGTGRNEGQLKKSAPRYMGQGYDLDKLQRCVGDALTGVVLRDDRQIAVWSARKRWGFRGRLDVTVAELDGQEP